MTPRPGSSFLENFIKFLNKKKSPVIDTTLALGYFNIFSDIYILVLPISAVLGLNMPTRRKVGLSLIFMAGILYVGLDYQHIEFPATDLPTQGRLL